MAELAFAEVGEILQPAHRIESCEVTVEWNGPRINLRRGTPPDAPPEAPAGRGLPLGLRAGADGRHVLRLGGKPGEPPSRRSSRWRHREHVRPLRGPIVTEAAERIGADPAATAMGVAWGDAWTHMVQPLQAIPMLAIAGLGVRQIMGYTAVALVVSGVVIGAGLLVL
ncbi:TIGR00366 family protein [Prauserella oleivorans]|uniref:TIGR00366 family protein n=1 Tax=Prauserella oleivorans TaxID=1478153 RepID=A0ABW5WC87_9PSEU